MNLKKTEFSKISAVLAKYKYVIVVLATGLMLLGFPSNNEESADETVKNMIEFDVAAFEKRIENALSVCEGVGNVNIILSIESGAEKVYAKEEKRSIRKSDEKTNESDSEGKPSIISEGSGKEVPVLIKERYPEFRGAVVVCDGAERTDVRTSVIEAVGALTGLSSDRISVVKMK